MKKKGLISSREIISIGSIFLVLILIIPLFNALNDPEKLIGMLPSLLILAIFFELIRRVIK